MRIRYWPAENRRTKIVLLDEMAVVMSLHGKSQLWSKKIVYSLDEQVLSGYNQTDSLDDLVWEPILNVQGLVGSLEVIELNIGQIDIYSASQVLGRIDRLACRLEIL